MVDTQDYLGLIIDLTTDIYNEFRQWDKELYYLTAHLLSRPDFERFRPLLAELIEFVDDAYKKSSSLRTALCKARDEAMNNG